MKKLKWIYICDHCGSTSLPRTMVDSGGIYHTIPDEWGTIGSNVHLCPTCYRAYIDLISSPKIVSEDQKDR